MAPRNRFARNIPQPPPPDQQARAGALCPTPIPETLFHRIGPNSAHNRCLPQGFWVGEFDKIIRKLLSDNGSRVCIVKERRPSMGLWAKGFRGIMLYSWQFWQDLSADFRNYRYFLPPLPAAHPTGIPPGSFGFRRNKFL